MASLGLICFEWFLFFKEKLIFFVIIKFSWKNRVVFSETDGVIQWCIFFYKLCPSWEIWLGLRFSLWDACVLGLSPLVPPNVPSRRVTDSSFGLDCGLELGIGTASWPRYRRDGDGGEGEQEIPAQGAFFFSENDEREGIGSYNQEPWFA